MVATFRALVAFEEPRSNKFNTRAAAVLSACSIVTAVSGFSAKDLYTKNFETFSDRAEWATVVGLTVTLLALAATVAWCLSVLLPKTRFAYSSAHVRAWAGGTEGQPTPTGSEEAPPLSKLTDRRAVLERHAMSWDGSTLAHPPHGSAGHPVAAAAGAALRAPLPRAATARRLP